MPLRVTLLLSLALFGQAARGQTTWPFDSQTKTPVFSSVKKWPRLATTAGQRNYFLKQWLLGLTDDDKLRKKIDASPDTVLVPLSQGVALSTSLYRRLPIVGEKVYHALSFDLTFSVTNIGIIYKLDQFAVREILFDFVSFEKLTEKVVRTVEDSPDQGDASSGANSLRIFRNRLRLALDD